MKKVLYVMLIAVIALSCKKQDTNELNSKTNMSNVTNTLPKVVDNRLVFTTTNSFYDFIKLLDKNESSALKTVNEMVGFKSLFGEINKYYKNQEELPEYLQDFEDFGLPNSFQMLLNKDGEIQIGNEIVWYNKGTKYFIENLDEKKLHEVKNGKNLAQTKSIKVGKDIMKIQNSDLSGRTGMGYNALDARHQKEFWQVSPASGNRKFVHEIQSYYDGGNNGVIIVWYSGVVLRVKMEWRGRRSWQPAGESRSIEYNLQCNNQFNAPYYGFTTSPTATFSGNVVTNGNYQLVIASANGSGTLGTTSGWTIDLSGTILHQVIGDAPYNAWLNAGYPLW